MRLSKCKRNDEIVVTIIIPVFNQSHTIKRCMDSILSADSYIRKEIILVNDGSTDDSEKYCLEYENKYEEVKYFYQENKGVSAARNLGIKKAIGKYIFYLDADDELKSGTIEKVTAFFESVENEVDMVTYRIDTIYDGRILAPHFRYKYLTESKVYDLQTMPYIGQTTMNIVVKNKFEDNILFDESQSFSEDQRYCCDVLKDKLKLGYCEEGVYIYYRSDASSSGRLAGSCYIFEQCTRFFEELFSQYKEVPMAFQGLFVNDFAWKLCTNILLPYHYDGEKYYIAVKRLKNLLNRCDNSVIIGHPQIDFFEKFYMLRMKENSNFKCRVNNRAFRLVSNGKCYVSENVMEIVLTKLKVKGTKVRISGFLKSVFFQFYTELPTLCAVENDGYITRKLKIYESSHNYYLSHEKTQKFWAFSYECDITEVKKVGFKVEVGGYWFPVKYYFMPLVPFSHECKKYKYECDDVLIKIDKANDFVFERVKKKVNKNIWLYYDCAGVVSDNGIKQFLHDYMINDSIYRYYVVTDERQKTFLPDNECWVEFGTKQHKKLFLKSDKIITAYIEELNIIPYPREMYDKIADKLRFEVIYLQHGVLHIDMPWKYTPERIIADRVVVSTEQEAKLFMKNGFTSESLIRARMPRFDKKREKERKGGKILLAPSWRSYLVGQYKKHKWQQRDAKFLSSTYYKRLHNLLVSKKLEEILEDNDYILEVKLHPIFTPYKKYFDIESERVRMIESIDDIMGYDIFITDFSSFMYDFLYQNIPVLLFIPDEMEFKSGMNGYRRFDDNDGYWQRVSIEECQIIKCIEDCITNRGYVSKDVDFFACINPCDAIYDNIKMS